jgi:hypothetical protein
MGHMGGAGGAIGPAVLRVHGGVEGRLLHSLRAHVLQEVQQGAMARTRDMSALQQRHSRDSGHLLETWAWDMGHWAWT